MGRAAAIAYAREGADVAINYLPMEEPDAQEVIQLIGQAGQRGFAIPGDLRKEAFCQRLVAEAVDKLGGLDILVCNAGRQQARASIMELTSEDFDATMKTNIYAPFWIIKSALPHLPPGSAIIGTTSEQAYDPAPELYDYAQTKAATMNYVKSLAKQLGPRGIRVKRRRTGSCLDATTGLRRLLRAEVSELRQRHRAGPSRRSRQNWHQSMCSSQRVTQVMPAATFTARVPGSASRKARAGLPGNEVVRNRHP